MGLECWIFGLKEEEEGEGYGDGDGLVRQVALCGGIDFPRWRYGRPS